MPPVTRKRKAQVEAVEDVGTVENTLPHSLGWKPDLSKDESVKPALKILKRETRDADLTSQAVHLASLKAITPKKVATPKKAIAAPKATPEKETILKEIITPLKKEDSPEKISPEKLRTPKRIATPKKETSNEKEGSAKKTPKKPIKYHFTPGITPFPNHIMPTHEACEEVNRILSEAHGKVEAPKVVATPSMKAAGCGNVPDLLDALIRTRLSANTSSGNANRALEGLQNAYGLQKNGPGKGSINWDAVRHSDIPAIAETIKRGGHQNVKALDIKTILDTVYAQNAARLEFLHSGAKSNDPEYINVHEEPVSKEAKSVEISRLSENMLSLDRIAKMKPFEAMEEMMRFKGIGVKTSSCVLLFCMKIPSFAVDTHVWRLSKWLGWVPEKASRDQCYSHCEVRVPDHLKYSLHQLLIVHGKRCYRCKSNTSFGTTKWNETVCPIEGLVDRMDGKKQAGHVSPKKEHTKVGLNGKKSPSKNASKGRKVKKEYYSDTDSELSDEMLDSDESEG
ncbi:uncharacterized protein RAG0_16013 [Rhynchosporium agropyri]|uniref:HhH-GPD domain-containing protein n=1 Tax=Rhynchosporium agropyri TaxID=914238 RepID=A0A1E1LNJ6_9HELO|nr:uncharacterized protein RAG0_16013 [Rhynchosporium agropyri]